MLRVKNEQFRILKSVRLNEFVTRLQQHLSEFFHEPISQMTNIEYSLFLKEGVARALQYKLETEHEIIVYFSAILTLGVDFENEADHKTALSLLTDKVTPTSVRTERLIEYIENL